MQSASDDAAVLVVARRVLDVCDTLAQQTNSNKDGSHAATTTTATTPSSLSAADAVVQLHADVDVLLRDALAVDRVQRHMACFRALLKSVLRASAYLAHDAWLRVLHAVCALLHDAADSEHNDTISSSSSSNGGAVAAAEGVGALPWLHRAFVLKEMNALTDVALVCKCNKSDSDNSTTMTATRATSHDDDSDEQQRQQQAAAVTERARSVGAALIRFALQHSTHTTTTTTTTHSDGNAAASAAAATTTTTTTTTAGQRAQLCQLAYVAIATLPRAALQSGVVHDLVTALPATVDVCVAVIAYAHTDDSTRAIFAQYVRNGNDSNSSIATTTTTASRSNDDSDDNDVVHAPVADATRAGNTTADAATAAAYAAVREALQSHYASYGVVEAEQLCERLIHDEAQCAHVGAWHGLHTRVLQPLLCLLRRDKQNNNSSNNNNDKSSCVDDSSGNSRARIAAAVARRLSVPFVCTCFAQVWCAYAEAIATTTTTAAAVPVSSSSCASDVTLSQQALLLARTFADLASFAALPATAMTMSQMTLFLAPVTAYMTADAADAASEKDNNNNNKDDDDAEGSAAAAATASAAVTTTTTTTASVLDMPMPLFECFLVLVHYSLPCLRRQVTQQQQQQQQQQSLCAPSAAASTTAPHVDAANVSSVSLEARADMTTTTTTAAAEHAGSDKSSRCYVYEDAFVRVMHFCKTRVLCEVDDVLWRAAQCSTADTHTTAAAAAAASSSSSSLSASTTATATTADVMQQSGDTSGGVVCHTRGEHAAQMALLRSVARLVQRLCRDVSSRSVRRRGVVTASWHTHERTAAAATTTTVVCHADAHENSAAAAISPAALHAHATGKQEGQQQQRQRRRQ